MHLLWFFLLRCLELKNQFPQKKVNLNYDLQFHWTEKILNAQLETTLFGIRNSFSLKYLWIKKATKPLLTILNTSLFNKLFFLLLNRLGMLNSNKIIFTQSLFSFFFFFSLLNHEPNCNSGKKQYYYKFLLNSQVLVDFPCQVTFILLSFDKLFDKPSQLVMRGKRKKKPPLKTMNSP